MHLSLCTHSQHNLTWLDTHEHKEKGLYSPYQQEDTGSTAPGQRPTPRDGWSWRVAAAHSTVEFCTKHKAVTVSAMTLTISDIFFKDKAENVQMNTTLPG